MSGKLSGMQNSVLAWKYSSSKSYSDPFNEIELDVIITDSAGIKKIIPAYWAGGNEWRVRFTPHKADDYTLNTICTDINNEGLHDVQGILTAVPFESNNPIIKNGKLGVKNYIFEYENDKPFFWLGDTWWMSLCSRIKWPEEFQLLTQDRLQKGFTVIQIVAGLYPDMPGFDIRGANEAGFPWEKEYARINPAYFDMADLRIEWLVRSGLMPCIVGCWGYYLPMLGMKKMKQHWRNIIARWGAYPVIWCLAGEASMPFYLSKDPENDKNMQISGWTDIGKYVREIDPYKRLITIHPTQVGRDQVSDDKILDFNMLQTGHSGYITVSDTLKIVSKEYNRKPEMPVVVAEVNYEGIIHGTQAENQRHTFWVSFLSGAKGFTYGANGLWQLNSKTQPYGPSPHGGTWGNTPWEEAYLLKGSEQLGLAKKFLQRFEWWKFEPHQEWVNPCGTTENTGLPFIAGIDDKVRLLYIYDPIFPWSKENFEVTKLNPETKYKAYFWNPIDGNEVQIGIISPDDSGKWKIPPVPVFHDWVVGIERITKNF